MKEKIHNLSKKSQVRYISRRDFLRGVTLFTSVALASSMLEACATEVTEEPTEALKEPTGPKRGGTLTIGQPAGINTVNPYTSMLMVWVETQESVFDTLTNHDPRNNSLVPKLAKEFNWENDDTSLLLKLQEGVKFHDGSDLTAEDVRFSIEYHINPDNVSAYSGWLRRIESVDVVDNYTVRINTGGYAGEILSALALVQITSSKQKDQLDETPIGTGPFKWAEWQLNDFVRLERNPDYWQEGLPYVDEIIFRVLTEPESRVAALETGQVDMIYDIEARYKSRLEEGAGISTVTSSPLDRPFLFYINTRRPPFDNIKVRQAFAYAIDRENFVNSFLNGMGVATSSTFHPDHWAAKPAVKDYYTYDLNKSATLLEEAGYPNGEGLSFSLLVPIGFTEYKQLSEMIQASFLELGADVKVEEVELAVWGSRLVTEFDFDVACDNIRWMSLDPAVGLGYAYLLTPSEVNISGITPDDMPEYNDILIEASSTKDMEKRKELYYKAQELWAEYAGGPFVCFRGDLHGLRDHVKGFYPDSSHQQEFDTIWLDV